PPWAPTLSPSTPLFRSGSRLLLVALAGADVDTLAAQSHAMAATLSADARFGFVANGAGGGLEAIPAHLRPYRYLLSPTLDVQRRSEEHTSELQSRENLV